MAKKFVSDSPDVTNVSTQITCQRFTGSYFFLDVLDYMLTFHLCKSRGEKTEKYVSEEFGILK